MQSQAFKDIYAHIPGKEKLRKDPLRLQEPPNGIPSILGANKEDHSRYRRLFAHAFSEKGLREQESHIPEYVDLLVNRLGERAKASQHTNMLSWYNMTVFDIIGDLAWGESFDCLQDRKVHEWTPAIQGAFTFLSVGNIVRRHGLGFLVPYFVSKHSQALRATNYRYAQEKVSKRTQRGGDRGDFWDRIVIKSANNNETGDGMSEGEMLNNASVLVLSGSETSATVLCGMRIPLRTTLWQTLIFVVLKALPIFFSSILREWRSSMTRFDRPSSPATKSTCLK